MAVSDWSTTAADNDAAPPNGAPEGMAPSGVNDTIRQMMADIKALHDNATTPNASASEIGFKGIPQSAKNTNYTMVLSDAGKDIVYSSGSAFGTTFTIPSNASSAFPVGTVISITNLDNDSITIAITSDTLTLAGTTSTGSRTLGQNGTATIKKVTSTGWLIYGVGLT